MKRAVLTVLVLAVLVLCAPVIASADLSPPGATLGLSAIHPAADLTSLRPAILAAPEAERTCGVELAVKSMSYLNFNTDLIGYTDATKGESWATNEPGRVVIRHDYGTVNDHREMDSGGNGFWPRE